MLTISMTLAASLLSAAAASPVNDVSSRQVIGNGCTDIRIFLARGSGEPYTTPGNVMADLLVPAVCNGRASCDYADIEYPATIPSDYCGESETEGVTQGVQQITNHMKACPGTKMVLAGYSQGAQVVGDMIGGSVSGTNCHAGNGALDPSSSPGNASKSRYLQKTVTVITNEDSRCHCPLRRHPAHAWPVLRLWHSRRRCHWCKSLEPFLFVPLIDSIQGLGARTGDALTGFNAYADKVGSYCTAGDQWCASGTGPDAGTIHGHSVNDNYQAAADFINGKLG